MIEVERDQNNNNLTAQHWIEQHQYRKALDAAEAEWGPHQTWQMPQQLLTGGRIFSNLGLRRKAQACRLLAWRRNRQDPDAIYHYVSVILERRGPLRALALVQQFGDLQYAPEARRAEWLAMQGSLFSQYRDWQTATDYIEQARNLASTCAWVRMEQAYLFEAQDNYQAAWNCIAELIPQGYRPAIQYGAHLKTLAQDTAAAIAILESHLFSIESIGIALQLYRLHHDADQWALAKRCLERARALMPAGYSGMDEGFAVADFELALKERDLARAHAALEHVKSPYYRTIRQHLANASDQQHAVQLDVPFVRQHHMTCAPATLTAISCFWEQSIDHLDIVEAICYDGTSNHAERRWARDQGWVLREFRLEPETAYALIDRGVPFTLSTVAPGSAHLQAVIGYDKRKGVYLIRDPYYPSLQEFLVQELGQQFRSSGPRCLALVPADQQHRVAGIVFPDSEFYDAYFELLDALEKHQRSTAESLLAQLQQQDSQHRLTRMAERSLARYNDDILRELNAVEQLLETFPDDLNLKSDKAYLLGRLGRHQAQIDFLEAQVQQAATRPHPLLAEQLAFCLSSDNRQSAHTRTLLQYVLRYQPTNAAALWSLAGVHWDQANYEKAFEYYRLCSTLEDKREGYINSYFKAARYLKRTDEALTRLRERAQLLGRKSVHPWESLYYALCALSLDAQGIEVLEQALELHPQNSDLIARLVRGYLYGGRTAQSAALFNKSKQLMSEGERLSLAADISRYRNDWEKESGFNARILNLQSLNYGVIEAQARLLGRHQGNAAAIGFIESRLELNPQDRALLFMKLDWMCDMVPQLREAFANTIVDILPRDYEGYLRLARIQQEQRSLDDAHKNAAQAVEINPYNVDALIALGDILFQQDNIEQALVIYRRTIEYSVDTDDIFHRLLRCHSSYEAKCRELRYILDQLMRQTSYGNGILEYREVARNLIKDEELLAFLEQAVELRSDLWQSWTALSMHLSTMNQLQRANQIATDAINRFPLLPRLFLERSNIAFVAQDFATAESDLREALRINPQWMTAITRLSELLEAQKRYPEALALLQDALQFSPANAILHGCTADLLVGNGETTLAIAHLEKALELDPQYDWAWDRFRGLTTEAGQPDAAQTLAKAILARKPHDTVVWCKLAEFDEDMTSRLAVLEEALAHHPKNENLNLLKCRTLFNLHQIGAARAFLQDEKWKGHPPASLLAYDAWIEARYERYAEAIRMMTGVVARYPHYYDGWRLLTNWNKTLGNYREAIKHMDTCVRLHPHSPDTLTMAAEIYLEASHHDIEVDLACIGKYLEKALVLAPRDQYNGLTWLDFLIERQDWPGFERAKTIIHFDPANPYYQARFLQAAARQKDREQALKFFAMILESSDSNEWLYLSSYRELCEAGYEKPLYTVLNGQLDNGNANAMLGRLWAQYCLDHEKKTKKMLQYLERLEVAGPRWINAMEAIFHAEKNRHSADLVIKHYRQELSRNGRLWSLVTFHYSRHQLWQPVRQWCQSHWQRNDNNAWAVYLYSYGLRLNGQWQQAYRVNDFAASLPTDDYYDRILLWQLIESVVLHRQPFDEDRLARIRLNELSDMEQYCYQLVMTLRVLASEGHLDNAAGKVVDAFKMAKKSHRDIAATKPGLEFHRQIRQSLLRCYDGGIWRRWWWQYRLFALR